MLTSMPRTTPELRDRRNSIPVPRTPIRPGLTQRVFIKCVDAAIAPLRHRSCVCSIMGSCSWLSFKSNIGARLPSSGGTPASTGLCDKQGKKRSVPKPNYTFPRHVSRLHLHGGQAVSRTNKWHQNMRAVSSDWDSQSRRCAANACWE